MILVKVYGAFHPVDDSGSPAGGACFHAVAEAGRDAIGQEEEWLFYEGDLLRISFEGRYFPLDDVLDALEKTLPEGAGGRLDYLDLEAWTLTRHTVKDGEVAASTRSLNHVLDHAGH